MGKRYIWQRGQWVEPQDYQHRTVARSYAVPTPRIISDYLPDVVNPIDGKPYDSKSAYYRKVKDEGCEIVPDKPDLTKRDTPAVGGVAEAINDAYSELEAK